MELNSSLDDDLFLKLIPEWGAEKVEKLRFLYQIGDLDRKQRIHKILSLSAKKLINDPFLPTHVLLPPSTKEECLGKGEIYLGDVCYGRINGNEDRILYPLYLDIEDIKNHLIITGLSGVGKTTLAYNLVIELAKKKQNAIIFDWNRTWRNLLSLSEAENPFVKDITVYTIGRDLKPFVWNMLFSPPPNVNFANWLSIVANKPLQKSLLAGQGVADYIENEAEHLMYAYQKGILKLLPNIDDIRNNVEKQFAQARQLLWKQSTERVTKELTRPSVHELFGSRSPINIATDILEKPGITIIEMDIETPEHIRVLFQELMLTYCMLYFLHKGEATDLRTAVVLEEFPNMLPKSKIEKQVGSDIIKTLFKEGRKFGLGIIAIAQETSELPNYVVGNAKIQAHFALQTKNDIDASANSLFLKPHQIPFIDLIWRGKCIVKVKGRLKNCLIKTPPPPFKRAISDEELVVLLRK